MASNDDIPQNLIPENLLAMAKDSRYLTQCQELVQRSLNAVMLLEGGSNEARSDSSTQRQRRSWLLSCALYILWALVPLGRTVGMQACGLAFDDGKMGGSSRRRWIASVLCSSVISWMIIFPSEALLRNVRLLPGHADDALGLASIREPDALRGQDRRQVHEQLRRQMLARAGMMNTEMDNVTITATARSGCTTNGCHDQQSSQISFTSGDERQSLLQYFWSVLYRAIKSGLEASFHVEGPHEVTRSNNESMPNNTTYVYSITVWLIRLHLAQYLLTGEHPTILHRILSLEPKLVTKDEASTTNHSSIVFPPRTNRTIATLIFSQVAGLFCRNTAERFAQLAVKYTFTSKNDQTNAHSVSSRLQMESKLAKYFSTDGHVSTSGTKGVIDSSHQPQQQCSLIAIREQGIGTAITGNSKHVVCAICRTHRRYPAAPASCGHVCCWSCLYHWVSYVRPECPLCRSPCHPQDVTALHHYEPASYSEEG